MELKFTHHLHLTLIAILFIMSLHPSSSFPINESIYNFQTSLEHQNLTHPLTNYSNFNSGNLKNSNIETAPNAVEIENSTFENEKFVDFDSLISSSTQNEETESDVINARNFQSSINESIAIINPLDKNEESSIFQNGESSSNSISNVNQIVVQSEKDENETFSTPIEQNRENESVMSVAQLEKNESKAFPSHQNEDITFTQIPRSVLVNAKNDSNISNDENDPFSSSSQSIQNERNDTVVISPTNVENSVNDLNPTSLKQDENSSPENKLIESSEDSISSQSISPNLNLSETLINSQTLDSSAESSAKESVLVDIEDGSHQRNTSSLIEFGKNCDKNYQETCRYYHPPPNSNVECVIDSKRVSTCRCNYLKTWFPKQELCVLNVFSPCSKPGSVDSPCGENAECTEDTLELNKAKFCRCKNGFVPSDNSEGIPAFCVPSESEATEWEHEDYLKGGASKTSSKFHEISLIILIQLLRFLAI